MRVPDGLRDEEVLFLGDVFSTAYSCAEAAEIRAGDVVVVIGCGPVGLMCIKAARLLGASAVVALDRVDYRLEKARSLGAQPEQPDSPTLQRRLSELTEGRGADAVLEAVGSPAALDLAIELARPGAVVSIAGYHTETAYAFPIHTAYRKNLTMKIGRCNARRYMTELLPLVAERKVELTDIVTHTLPLSEGVRGYEAFANHRESALKVVLKP
jgi:threonine dehydrogenase-like Zn-dependent dehydrogenase